MVKMSQFEGDGPPADMIGLKRSHPMLKTKKIVLTK